MKLLDAGKKILKKLNDAGFEAYFVGGFVRDLILNLKPNDIDITTNAMPEDVINIFEKTNAHSKKYKAITVYIDNYSFEVTTYRKDISYANHRHPITCFVKTLDEDLERRDFTINALAMDIDGNIIDKYNGRLDLKNKLIRCIGNPTKRFEEDALRLLRACYFASKLGFEIDEMTTKAMVEKSSLIKVLSSERILSELNKILKTTYPKIGLRYLYTLNLSQNLGSLNKGISYLVNNNIEIKSFQVFIGLAYYFDSNLFNEYNIRNDLKKIVISAVKLIANDRICDKLSMYENGLDVVLLANEIAKTVHNVVHDKNTLIKIYNDLTIHSINDIKIEVVDLKKILNKEAGNWITPLLKKIAIAILNGTLKNEKESIIQFVKKEEDEWNK